MEERWGDKGYGRKEEDEGGDTRMRSGKKKAEDDRDGKMG